MVTRNGNKKRPGYQPLKGGGWITRERRLAILIRDRFTCQHCRVDLRDARPRTVHLDHLVPRVVLRDDSNENLFASCASCNCRRGDKTIESFCKARTVARIRRQVKRPVNLALAKCLIRETPPCRK